MSEKDILKNFPKSRKDIIIIPPYIKEDIGNSISYKRKSFNQESCNFTLPVNNRTKEPTPKH